MKLIFCVLTILISLALRSNAATVNVTERDEYLNSITEDIWNQLIEYDLSNLPIGDYNLAYNTSTWGHELIGTAYYEDGFLMDIESAGIDARTSTTSVSQSALTLSSAIHFNNVDICFDVRAEFTVGQKIGTVVIKPTAYIYDIRITQDLATMNVTGTVTNGRNNNGNFVWDYVPADPLFARLRRHYLTQALGNFIENAAVPHWIPILQEMLTIAVNRRKFVELVL